MKFYHHEDHLIFCSNEVKKFEPCDEIWIKYFEFKMYLALLKCMPLWGRN